jgi:hypothetical protein
MRRIALASAVVLAGGLLMSSSAQAEDRATKIEHRWIAVEDNFAFVLPNGETFAGDEEPQGESPEEEEPAPVGSQFFLSEALYATADGVTPGAPKGRDHIECTAQVTANVFVCEVVWVFENGSQLHGAVSVDFGAQSETEPMQFDIAVTGGTDDFYGATGEVSLLDISTTEEETVTLYEADVVLP